MANDGGPAFCGAYDQVFVDMSGKHPAMKLEARSRGMSLRDYFAGQALAGGCGYPSDDAVRVDDIAREAYRIADAMLAERERLAPVTGAETAKERVG